MLSVLFGSRSYLVPSKLQQQHLQDDSFPFLDGGNTHECIKSNTIDDLDCCKMYSFGR
jgi:hypothetical protein